MVKPSQRVEINTFVQGIITEANPLNFPPHASVCEENFVINRDGTRKRRLGVDFENGYTLRAASAYSGVNTAFTTYKWVGVGGLSGRDFLVVQVNNVLFFYDLSFTSLSSSGYLNSITIAAIPTETVASFCSVEGKLVIASGSQSIAIVSYNGGTSFTTSETTLKTRDIWGIEVPGSNYETDPTYRGTISDFDARQAYNWYNQSWGVPRRYYDTDTYVDPAVIYKDANTYYPSNSEVVWSGLEFRPGAAGTPPKEVITPTLFQDVIGHDVLAPKGYFIIDLIDRGESRRTVLSSNQVKYPAISVGTMSNYTLSDTTDKGATVVEEFAGRVFYAGFGGTVIGGDARSPSLSNYVGFSQLVKNANDIGKCYQEGDPTSRENSDIVDTDGGLIRISGAKKIVALKSIGTYLVVFADNGIWVIDGGGDYGFSASNYKVSNLSSHGCISPFSVINGGSNIYYWSEDGIFVITKDQLGDLTINSLTQNTIQTLYNEIPYVTKLGVNGTYDATSLTVRWLFKEGTMFTSSSISKELVFDTVLGSFTINTIKNLPDYSTEVCCIFTYKNVEDTSQSVKYLALKYSAPNLNITFATQRDATFLDWKSSNGVGVDAKAFLLTGQVIGGDSSAYKQVPYCIFHFRKTEQFSGTNIAPLYPSSCLARFMWDWSNDEASNRWSELIQVYRFRKAQFHVAVAGANDNGFETVVTKNKVRGRGRAFSLYLETEPQKDCRILGWSLTVNGNKYV